MNKLIEEGKKRVKRIKEIKKKVDQVYTAIQKRLEEIGEEKIDDDKEFERLKEKREKLWGEERKELEKLHLVLQRMLPVYKKINLFYISLYFERFEKMFEVR